MDTQYAEVYPDLYRRHWWWRVREQILLRRISVLLAKTPGQARILDIGCGAGLFFEALQQFGQIEGIESDTIAIEQSGRWRKNIFHRELDSSFKPPDLYDLILFLDVLEHVPDPEQLLRDARPLLKSDGRILITVPAFNWLWTRHDDMNHHLRRYSMNDLQRTVERAGLVTTESTYLFQSLVLPKLAVRAREKLLGQSEGVPTVPGRMLNNLLQGWFRAEFMAFSWLPFGSSVMLLARR